MHREESGVERVELIDFEVGVVGFKSVERWCSRHPQNKLPASLEK